MSDLELTDEEWKAKRKAEREAEYLSRLRDRFAGQALSGITGEGSYSSSHPDTMASHAYSIADAMLAERSKP